MKKFFFYTLLFLAVVGVLLYVYSFDDELHPEAQAWIDELNEPAAFENNAFVYALGIHAPEKMEVHELAKKRLATNREYIASNHLYDSYTYENHDYQLTERLTLPNQSQNCAWQEKACQNKWLAATAAEIDQYLIANSILPDRYEKYLAFENSKHVGAISIASIMPYYQYLIAGQKLKQLKTLSELKKGVVNAEQASYQALENIRSKLAQAGSLIDKSIMLAMVGIEIDFLNLLAQEGLLEDALSISQLSQEEASFDKAFKYEFYYGASIYPSLKNANNLGYPKFILPIILKPNMSINMSYEYFAHLIAIDNLNWRDYQRKSSELKRAIGEREIHWRNPVGSILVSTARPSYFAYKEESFALDAKIDLYNQLIASGNYKTSWTTNTVNPFFPDKTAIVKDGMSCFETPFNKSTACLPIISK